MRPGAEWIGVRIREARERRSLTRTELAVRVGTSLTNVSRWEDGQREPGLRWLGPLCDALEVPADYFRR